MQLCDESAVTLAGRLARREVSAREVLEAHLARIAAVNPTVNAICTLVADQAHDVARGLDDAIVRDGPRGPLHGLPIAVKDLAATRGIRTTLGSRIYADHVPDADALFVRRLREAGAVILGKTNTPEFGAGSQTFNEVFGATRNPYDLTKTCGGSSGGAAVALATGMLPIADGSDMGGSLRNPASFCNVVGFRPSPGRVPSDAAELAWTPLSVSGPMGRSVADAALLLSAMAGPDARDPISLTEPGEMFRASLDRDFAGTRVAWSLDLGRLLVEPAVADVCERALTAFTDLGCVVDAAHPVFTDADDEAFRILRAWTFARERGPDVQAHRALVKDTVIWNVEQGLTLTGADVARAEATRVALYRRVVAFLEEYDYLVLPVVQVTPFPIDQPWVRQINGVDLKTYIDWMASCYLITLTSLPALSVPAGFTADGLPVGLQLVGRRHADLAVLQLGHALERITRAGRRRPSLPA